MNFIATNSLKWCVSLNYCFKFLDVDLKWMEINQCYVAFALQYVIKGEQALKLIYYSLYLLISFDSDCAFNWYCF